MPWIKDGVEYTESQIRSEHPNTSFPRQMEPQHVADFGYTWQEPTPPPKPTLEQVQAQVWAQVKAKRDELEASGFMYAGHPMDSDPRAVQRINTAVQAAQAAVGAGQPFKIDWTCMDGHVLPLDAVGMMGMPVYLALRANALHLHAKSLKTAIHTAATAEAVQAIDINSNWPAL